MVRLAVWIGCFFLSIHFCQAGNVPDLVFVQIPAQSEPHFSRKNLSFPSNRYVNGMRIVHLPAGGSASGTVPLTADFFSACDPAVSFDGGHILFTGKKSPEDSWQIWRMDRDGNNKIQITHRQGDCVMPLYVGALFHLNDDAPSEQFVYVSNDSGWINEYGTGPSYALYASRLDGSHSTRITYNLSSDFDPDVLPNGRIVFTSWRRDRIGLDSLGRFGLLAVNNDGTDLLPYYGNLASPRYKGMARVADNQGRVYFIEQNRPAWLGGGSLSYVTMRRPLHSHKVLSPANTDYFAFPCPLPDGALLASYRKSLDRNELYELHEIDTESGRRKHVVFASPDKHCVDAQVLAPHPVVKGRSSVVNLEKDTGVFFCLNVYTSDISSVKNLEPGKVKRVRVLEGVPSPAHDITRQGANPHTGTSFPLRRIAGVAPVEEDGSFHIEVPAHTPLSFQLLDERNMAVAQQQSWTWVVPREWRGCIGCHEDRELSPPNQLTKAVIQKAKQLTLPPERRRTVDFIHQIKPVLENKCSGAGCHSAGESHPELDVNKLVIPGKDARFFGAFINLLSPIEGREGERYVVPGKAKESPLIWHILGEKTGQSKYSSAVMHMPPGEALTDLEKTLLIEWIDLGALYDVRATIETIDLKSGAQGE